MGSVTHAGQHHDSRESTEMCAGDDAVYRIHVRLKPEGAPKRYASEANRRAWEAYPLSCLNAVREHGTPAGYLQLHTEQSERDARL